MSAHDDVLEGLEERYQLYLGIPRQMIPWFPTIDADKCVGCKECMTFCHDTVYAFDEETQGLRGGPLVLPGLLPVVHTRLQ